jgi:hypothetical protein
MRGDQYLALPPDISKIAPVLNALASEQSHSASAATSSGSPSRRNGLANIMESTVSFPRSLITRVSIVGLASTNPFDRECIFANSEKIAIQLA